MDVPLDSAALRFNELASRSAARRIETARRMPGVARVLWWGSASNRLVRQAPASLPPSQRNQSPSYERNAFAPTTCSCSGQVEDDDLNWLLRQYRQGWFVAKSRPTSRAHDRVANEDRTTHHLEPRVSAGIQPMRHRFPGVQ